MTNNYQDKVNETFDKYAFQIQEAINQLRRENPNLEFTSLVIKK